MADAQMKLQWDDDATPAVAVDEATRNQWAREMAAAHPEGTYRAMGDTLMVVWPDGTGGFFVHDCVVRRDGWLTPDETPAHV